MTLSKVPNVEGVVFGSHYLAIKKIGHGSFGEIYLGKDVYTNLECAIKFEVSTPKNTQLYIESKIYTMLSGTNGFSKIFWYGVENGLNILVIELLGNSIDNLFSNHKKSFSLKTVLMIGDQMLRLIQSFHLKNLIHRDIKPDNFLIGLNNNSNQLYLIDFGLSKFYCDPNTKVHIKYTENHSLTGTARYASVNALSGKEQSRRDDLESIGYVLIYLLKGNLPWQGLTAENPQEKHLKILEKKKNTSIENLCEDLPIIFLDYFKIIFNLDFIEEPPYELLRSLFLNYFIFEKNLIYDFYYDWNLNIKKNFSFKEIQVFNSQSNSNSAPTFKTIPVVQPLGRKLRITGRLKNSNSKKNKNIEIEKKKTGWTLPPKLKKFP